jgi:hypothetical protein
MSAKRIIAVAEAMMRQSRRAGGVFAFLALLGFAPVGWFHWKWLRDWPNPGRLGLLARLSFSGMGSI